MPSGESKLMWNELIRLSKSSTSTLQFQLREAFVAAILDGKIPVDQPMPPSRILAKQLGISRNTVMISYHTLLDDGYIVSRERQGYFVNRKILERRLTTEARPAENEPADHFWDSRLKRQPSVRRNIEKTGRLARLQIPVYLWSTGSKRFSHGSMEGLRPAIA